MNVKYHEHELNVQLLVLLSLFFMVLTIGVVTATFGYSLASIPRAQTPFQNQGTIDFVSGLKPVGRLPIGGMVNPDDVIYCLEQEDPEGCADQTSFHIPKGLTGVTGSCGTVISQAHLLADSLQSNNSDLLDSLNYSVDGCDYQSGSYTENYIPTYFVIDAYNLAGFKELSKFNPSNTLGKNLLSWWKSQTRNYRFIPYSTASIYQFANGQQDLTGCVIFINYPSGVHVGIINSFQLVNTNGDGVLTVLQSGTAYLIARFEVVGWKIKNLTLNPKEANSVAGFGCNSKNKI